MEVIQESRDRISAFQLDKESFLNAEGVKGRALVDSLLLCVLRVTEEVGNLSDQTKAAHPEVDWHAISGMRNRLVHDYGHVDRRFVWEAITQDFDFLEKVCKQITE